MYVFQRHIFSKLFPFFFSFSQKARNITSILLQDVRKERPDEINILVATNEFESFAIKYGKTHLAAKKMATIQQDLFGEFGAVWWVVRSCLFQLNVHKFTSSLPSYSRSHLHKALYSIYSKVISLSIMRA